MTDSSDQLNNDQPVRLHVPTPDDLNGDGIPDSEEIRTCCSGTSDARFARLILQMSISIGIVFMCLFKLSDDTLDCESSSLYVSLLSIVVGFYLSKK